MVCFLLTNFAIAAEHTPAAVVYENDRDAAIRALKLDLDRAKFYYRDPGKWIVTPLTPIPKFPRVVVITDEYHPPRSAVELRGPSRRSTLHD